MSDDTVADLRPAVAEPQRELDDRTAERDALQRELIGAGEQQTAAAEVLRVINSSPGDLTPVFDAILERAMRLCEATFGSFATFDGEFFKAVAHRNVPTELADALREPMPLTPGGHLMQIANGEAVVPIADFIDTEAYRSGKRWAVALVDKGGARTAVWLALRRDEALLGVLVIYREEVRPFSDKQIALLENFAAQAVIAMENARFITETREALEQQTATAEVLQIINALPGDLAAVFDAMLDKALGLCGAAFGCLWTYDGERVHAVALRGAPPDFAEFLTRAPHPVGPDNAHGRLLRGEPVVHITDVADDEAYRAGDPVRRNLVDLGGGRTLLAVALRKDDTFLGDFVIYRTEVRPFTEREIALLQNFAAQAVIAMENARLLGELRERTEELGRSVEELKALNEVSQAVSSTLDLRAVLSTILARSVALSGADAGVSFRYSRSARAYRLVEAQGWDGELVKRVRGLHIDENETGMGEAAARRTPLQFADLATRPSYPLHDVTLAAGFRSVLIVPLLSAERIFGAIVLERRVAGEFPEATVRLMETLAGQSVLAIQNARLLGEVQAARDTAEAAYRDLKAAQARLIQAEKMASLGQLTAGIAHEIKNPLNFVNNFADLSGELLKELTETAAPALATLSDNQRAEVDEVVEILRGNLEKIADHGKRADGIVKSMLEHSRGVSGKREVVDLNGLIEEALNLAYHGARAQDASFNITLEREFDPDLAQIELAPQEMTRVLLNLFGNGFYATTRRQRDGAGPDFRPMLRVVTRDLGAAVEVRVHDNGTGIAPEIRDKLFQPFFTTKPTGEGTGLGLSISYDIVAQQHGGTIEVDSRVDEFTEFTIRLPRYEQTTAQGGSA